MTKLFTLLLLLPALALGQTVDYQPFANGGSANVETQAAYLADLANPSALQNGFQTGIAKSNQFNKVFRQQSVVTSGIANAISQANGGTNVLDDGNVSNFSNIFLRATQNANSPWLSSVAGTNTITAAVLPLAIAPASYVAGQKWVIKPVSTNTGAATLNITGNVGGVSTPLGARNIKKRSPSGLVSLDAGDLVNGDVYQLMDDGTQLIVEVVDQTSGSWTPSLGGSATYTSQVGTFVRTGKMVCVQGSFIVNTIGTGSTSSVSGLPLTVNSGTWIASVGTFSSLATSIVYVSGIFGGGTNNISFFSMTAAGTGTASNAIFGNGSNFSFSGCYQST
jgi:hypothetical protein